MGFYILYDGELYHSDELRHYGVKGMKWGQNIFGKRRSKRLERKQRQNHKTDNDSVYDDPVLDAALKRCKLSKYTSDESTYSSWSPEKKAGLHNLYEQESRRIRALIKTAKTQEDRRRYEADETVLDDEYRYVFERDGNR
jgi:hypothetical protein